jgi:membrane-bound ClpP family serine protease
MREAAKLIAFILLIIGTIGLLVNEFVTDWGRGVTITFACLNVLGLVLLAFTAWRIGKR